MDTGNFYSTIKSPILQVAVPFLESIKHNKVMKEELYIMNLGQLQVLVEDLHTQIESRSLGKSGQGHLGIWRKIVNFLKEITWLMKKNKTLIQNLLEIRFYKFNISCCLTVHIVDNKLFQRT